MANKKINQLVSKTAILSTDIFGIGDATTGQLFKKTIAELQAAIGGAVISVNGLVGTVVLDTDDIQELATPTNKYFTDARARGAISLTVTGNSGASTYSSGTGVLNVPTYTLAGLGGISATFLSGTSGISYNSTTGVISYSGTVYTDASIRALLSGSTGISYNSTTGAISYSGTVYTDSSVRALISITTTGTSGASTYNNTTGVINVPNYTLAGLGGISLTSLSGGTGITYNNTTGAISYSGTVYTDASVRALISLTTTGTSGASTYNSTTGVLNIPQYTTDLSGYLPLTGGTLTGALNGTSATFTGNATTPITSINNGGREWGLFRTSTNGGFMTFQSSGATLRGYLGNGGAISSAGETSFGIRSESDLILMSGGNNIRLTIASTGAATFSSSVGVGGSPTGTYGTLSVFGGISTKNDNNGKLEIGRYSSGVPNSYIKLGANSDSLRITNNTDAADLVTITNAGNVGISNTSPGDAYDAGSWFTAKGLTIGNDTSTAGLQIVSSSTSTLSAIRFGDGASSLYDQGFINYNHSTDRMAFGANRNTTITLTSTNNCLIGTTSDNGERLYVSGAIRATGTITANSDITLKKNLLKIENALEKVEQINGYTYEFKEDDSKRHAGVIAQEIQTVLPEIVNKGNDGILGVEYGNISALLIEAIKEQNIKIKNLETLLASK